ncbi:MAG: hypothetical protein IKL53_06685 [Lachnospiraceae bacterium]|nr:hypothetical protein [Lachnospiraceae bacterium]
MTDLVYDFITMGIDMIMNAAILAAIVIIFRSSTLLSMYSSAQQANADAMRYYKQYSAYDNTKGLECSDVVSALVYFDKLDFKIIMNEAGTDYYATANNGTGYVHVIDGTASEVSYAQIREDLGVKYYFKSQIIEGPNSLSGTVSQNWTGDVITGIVFTMTEEKVFTN